MPSDELVSKQLDNNLSSKLIAIVDDWSSSLWRLNTPDDLMSNSSVKDITDESGNFIFAILMYGERKGEMSEKPYDHSGIKDKITDLNHESLWLYNTEKTSEVPEGFQEVKHPIMYIPTGKTSKCHKCSGRGRTKCRWCHGRGSVKRKKDGHEYWEPCSMCSGGWVDCNNCLGYGWVQYVIDCSTEYKISKFSNIEYAGSVPKSKFAKVTGEILFEERADYPQDLLRDMLIGGLDTQEYAELQGVVRDKFHKIIEGKLTNYEGNLKLVHDFIDDFFRKMPNPAQSNKLLEYEIVPIRLRISSAMPFQKARRRLRENLAPKDDENPSGLSLCGMAVR